jgi:hypothetical protein
MLTYRGFEVTKEEKLDKVTRDFSLLPEEKQDYILGVLQALAFAHETNEENDGNPPALPGLQILNEGVL